jgi:hypothetical protein
MNLFTSLFLKTNDREGTFTCIYAVKNNVENVMVPPVAEVNCLTGYQLINALPLLMIALVLVTGSLTQS